MPWRRAAEAEAIFKRKVELRGPKLFLEFGSSERPWSSELSINERKNFILIVKIFLSNQKHGISQGVDGNLLEETADSV